MRSSFRVTGNQWGDESYARCNCICVVLPPSAESACSIGSSGWQSTSRSCDIAIPGCVNGTAQLEYLPCISEKGGDSVGHLYYSYSTVQMQGVTGEYVGGCLFEKWRRCLERRIHLWPLAQRRESGNLPLPARPGTPC